MKNFRGIKKVVIVFGIISNIFLSCHSKKEILNYSVRIQNNYFESIGDVKIGYVNFETIEQGVTSQPQEIQKGEYIFSATSLSGLIFEATINFRGNKSEIISVLDSNGKLSIYN